jgi:hypothetical protein
MAEIAAIIGAAAGAISANQSRKAQKAAASRAKKMRQILSAPESPPPKLEEPAGADLTEWLRKRRGRAGTVLTGDLVPQDIGMKTLLG